jgi:hypothetical protein
VLLYLMLPTGSNSEDLDISTVIHSPVEATQFVLTFLGNPIFHSIYHPLMLLRYAELAILGRAPPQIFPPESLSGMELDIALWLAQLGGLILLVVLAIATWHWFTSGRDPIRAGLIAFIVFVVLTAGASAVGRLWLGIGYALSFRYTTIPLFAWVALIVLYVPSLNVRRATWVFTCSVLLLLPTQLQPVFGLRRVPAEHEQLQRAARAVVRGSEESADLVVLGAFDDDVKEIVRQTARRLRGTGVSIFGDR